MNQLEYAIEICRRLRERQVPYRMWTGQGEDPEVTIRRKAATITRVSETGVSEKGVDIPQAQEIAKQILGMADGMDLPPEFHVLLVRLGESLSSVRPATPTPDEGGDQSEERSGWQPADSELRPAFKPGEARRGLRDAATSSKGIRGPKDAALHEFVQRAQLAVLEERAREIGRGIDEVRRKSVEPARALFDRLGEAIEKKKSSRGKDL